MRPQICTAALSKGAQNMDHSDSSCEWWSHWRTNPCPSFGLSWAQSHGQRPELQVLTSGPFPQECLRGGSPVILRQGTLVIAYNFNWGLRRNTHCLTLHLEPISLGKPLQHDKVAVLREVHLKYMSLFSMFSSVYLVHSKKILK